MQIQAFFETVSSTLSYLVWDADSLDAVVIDPVLNYDPVNHLTSTAFAESILAVIEDKGLKLHWSLETHVHADHLSGGAFFRDRTGSRIGISEHIQLVQKTFTDLLNLGSNQPCDGRPFDGLFSEGEVIEAGTLRFTVMETPGHTPACVSYLIEDALFTGDALFMPDFGTGRCDFPKGSAEQLFHSIHEKIYGLPEDTRVFVGHDYQPGGRELAFETSVGESMRTNKQVRVETTREEFVGFRTQRDAQLNLPRLIFQALQVNIRAGELPPEESNGMRYVKLPIQASE